MSKVIRITVPCNRTFCVLIDIIFFPPLSGRWKSLSTEIYTGGGYVGTLSEENSAGTLTTKHLYLDNSENKWVMRLNDYRDYWSENNGGDGLLGETFIKWEVEKT